MNTRYYMVIIKGEIKTSEIMSCGYNRNNQKWDVKFNNGKTYSYAYLNVEKLTDPEVLNPNMYRISREGREFFDVNAIYVFRSRYESYWHICFGNGNERDYHRSEINIVESCLTQSQSSNVFEYIKQIAGLSNLKNEETGEKLLSKKFDKISCVGSDVALAKYLNPSSLQGKRTEREYIPIFPFGCNNSQYKAVKNAMENQISVIQGPPGTGKTQTILNIIANPRGAGAAELVLHADAADRGGLLLAEQGADGLAQTADDAVLLGGDDLAAFLGSLEDDLLIQGLDGVDVDDAGVDALGGQLFGGQTGFVDHQAGGDDGDIVALGELLCSDHVILQLSKKYASAEGSSSKSKPSANLLASS